MTNIESITDKLNEFSPEEQIDVLGKIDRILACEKKVVNTNEKGIYVPPLKNGQIVLVDFVGIGTVLNDKHFAIVWNPLANHGQVQVIPMSSKGQEMNDIGEIEGLKEKNNYVLYHQIQTVSRKSIRVWKTSDKKIAKLDAFQKKQVRSLYRYQLLKEKDLLYKIKNESKGIPISIPTEVLMHLNKSVYTEISENCIEVRLPHKQSFNTITLTENSIETKQKVDLLSKLTSEDKARRLQGAEEVQALIKATS